MEAQRRTPRTPLGRCGHHVDSADDEACDSGSTNSTRLESVGMDTNSDTCVEMGHQQRHQQRHLRHLPSIPATVIDDEDDGDSVEENDVEHVSEVVGKIDTIDKNEQVDEQWLEYTLQKMHDRERRSRDEFGEEARCAFCQGGTDWNVICSECGDCEAT